MRCPENLLHVARIDAPIHDQLLRLVHLVYDVPRIRNGAQSSQNRKMEERRKQEEAADGEGLKHKEKTKKAKEGQSIRAELMDLRYGWGLIMHGFLSPSECKQMIDRTEDIGYKPNDRVERISDCGRVTFLDKSLADKLWARVEPFLPPVIQPGNWKKKGTASRSGSATRKKVTEFLTGLNEYWRFNKYEEGQYFGAHCDGAIVEKKEERSKLTLMIYLSEGFSGGTTRFFQWIPRSKTSKRVKNEKKQRNHQQPPPDQQPPEEQPQLGGKMTFPLAPRDKETRIIDTRFGERGLAYEVVPRVGMAVLFFQEGLLHDGLAVHGGVKYVMRTDVRYERAKEPNDKEKEA